MPIFFSQVREDPNVELSVLNKLDKPDCVIVGSGGCTLLSMLNDNINKIDVIDSNIEQLFLIQLKIEVICYFKNKEDILNFFEGRLLKDNYDKVLFDIKFKLDSKCYDYWINNKEFIYNGINQNGVYELLFLDLVKSDFNFQKTFSKDNLIEKFGINAVENSNNEEFYVHFKNIFGKYLEKYKINNNYFFHQAVMNKYNKKNLPYYFDNIENIINNKHKINYVNMNYVDFLNKNKNKYDLIQTSNVTDWMNQTTLNEFIQNIKLNLKNNGFVVMRKFNGDYNLKNLLNQLNQFHTIESPNDISEFYKEVIIAQNSQ